MKFIDQSADQLYLSLISGAIPKDQVQILCNGLLETSMGSINASIIGASHFFEFKDVTGNPLFSELIACQKLDVKETIFYDRIKLANNYTKKFDQVLYKFKMEQIPWNVDIMSYFKKLCDKSGYRAGFSIRFQFPDTETQTKQNLPALTMLTALEYKNKIKINSLHSYPNEKQLVLTQTTISPIKN